MFEEIPMNDHVQTIGNPQIINNDLEDSSYREDSGMDLLGHPETLAQERI